MAKNSTKRQTAIGAPRPAQRTSLAREDWTDAARRVLEAKGVAAVKIDHLAQQLGVTRGSFYFHFLHRKDLLDALIQDWRDRNCACFEDLDKDAGLSGPALYEAVTDLWLEQDSFRPKLDLAVRDWGRVSKAVAREVAAADTARIRLLYKAMRTMGFEDDEALVRARISYLHQVGYFAVHFSEPRSARLRYVPLYLKVLTGVEGWRDRSNDPQKRPRRS